MTRKKDRCEMFISRKNITMVLPKCLLGLNPLSHYIVTRKKTGVKYIHLSTYHVRSSIEKWVCLKKNVYLYNSRNEVSFVECSLKPTNIDINDRH